MGDIFRRTASEELFAAAAKNRRDRYCAQKLRDWKDPAHSVGLDPMRSGNVPEYYCAPEREQAPQTLQVAHRVALGQFRGREANLVQISSDSAAGETAGLLAGQLGRLPTPVQNEIRTLLNDAVSVVDQNVPGPMQWAVVLGAAAGAIANKPDLAARTYTASVGQLGDFKIKAFVSVGNPTNQLDGFTFQRAGFSARMRW